jgi:hypothetical protein
MVIKVEAAEEYSLAFPSPEVLRRHNQAGQVRQNRCRP